MVICTLRRCLSVCHISESRHGAGQGRHGRRGTSCGGQAMWAITTNKRTYDQATPRVLISLSAINIARLLLQLGFPFRPVPSGTSSRSRSLRLRLRPKLSLLVVRDQRCVPSIVAPLNRYRGECGVSTNVRLSTTSITRSHAERVNVGHEPIYGLVFFHWVIWNNYQKRKNTRSLCLWS